MPERVTPLLMISDRSQIIAIRKDPGDRVRRPSQRLVRRQEGEREGRRAERTGFLRGRTALREPFFTSKLREFNSRNFEETDVFDSLTTKPKTPVTARQSSYMARLPQKAMSSPLMRTDLLPPSSPLLARREFAIPQHALLSKQSRGKESKFPIIEPRRIGCRAPFRETQFKFSGRKLPTRSSLSSGER